MPYPMKTIKGYVSGKPGIQVATTPARRPLLPTCKARWKRYT
jgi:hypothetical protein